MVREEVKNIFTQHKFYAKYESCNTKHKYVPSSILIDLITNLSIFQFQNDGLQKLSYHLRGVKFHPETRNCNVAFDYCVWYALELQKT